MGLQLEILSWEVHFIIMNTKIPRSLFCPACSPPLPWEPLQLKLRLTPSSSLVPWLPLTTPWLQPTVGLRRRSSSPRSAHPPLRTSAPKRPSRLRRLSMRRSARRVFDNICDGPLAHAVYKREAEAEAEADAQYLAGLPFAPHALTHAAAPLVAHAPVALPVAHAVAHSVTATVKHACRAVTIEHCVDNPKVKLVPVEVEHCHTVTKVACSDVENKIPKTTCEPVETTHVAHAAYGLPAVHHAGYYY